MYEYVTREYIRTHAFQNDGLFEQFEREKADYRFAPGAILPPSQEEKTIQLRIKVRAIIDQKFDGNYTKIDAKCGIHRDTLIKFVSSKVDKRRGLSRGALAKLCVGAALSIPEAEELFILQGFALDPKNNMLDAIVVECLKNEDDIYEFYDMCEEQGIPLDKKAYYM